MHQILYSCDLDVGSEQCTTEVGAMNHPNRGRTDNKDIFVSALKSKLTDTGLRDPGSRYPTRGKAGRDCIA